MKRFILTVTTTVLFIAASFAQSKHSTAIKTVIPREYLGHWQKGVFSLTSFEQYDGKYVGPANETSLSYVIEEDGSAKEYFIANTVSYNCRMQILGFRKGKIIFNQVDNSIEFQPSEGYYTNISCFTKSPAKKPYTDKDLYPSYSQKALFKKGEDGSIVLVTKTKDGGEVLVLKKI